MVVLAFKSARRFGKDMEVGAGEWVPAPESLNLTADMFVARVVGSRQGKLLLIQHTAASGTGGEFAVRRYTSTKVSSGDEWRHERIRLEPLNPEFEAWDLDPGEREDGPYRVRGESVRVLPYEEQ